MKNKKCFYEDRGKRRRENILGKKYLDIKMEDMETKEEERRKRRKKKGSKFSLPCIQRSFFIHPVHLTS